MQNSPNIKFKMPAEWEKHSAVWLAWPHDEISFPRIEKAEKEIANFIKAMHMYEMVNLLVLDDKMQTYATEILNNLGVDVSKVTFRMVDYMDAWMRDCGGMFVKGVDGQMSIIHWKFNTWGNKFPELQKDEKIPDSIKNWLGLPLVKVDAVIEGGAIEINGQGLCIATEQCVLNPNRNPGKNKTEIEALLKEYLGVEKTIWLKKGLVNDHTDGHIDEIARFVSPNKVVCAYEDNEQDFNYQILKDNYDVLVNSTDVNGERLEVIKLPIPHIYYDQDKPFEAGERASASYTNFYIGNDLVVASIFNDQNDVKALEILQSVFPDRKVIGIECSELVYGAGALHCMTQQQPAV